MRVRTRCSAALESLARSSPRNNIVPESALSQPAMHFASVLFPDPEGPANPKHEPWWIERVTSRSACTDCECCRKIPCCFAYDFESAWMEINRPHRASELP